MNENPSGRRLLSDRVRQLAAGQVAILVVGLLVAAYTLSERADSANMSASTVGLGELNATEGSLAVRRRSFESDEATARLGSYAFLLGAGAIAFVWFGRKVTTGAPPV